MDRSVRFMEEDLPVISSTGIRILSPRTDPLKSSKFTLPSFVGSPHKSNFALSPNFNEGEKKKSKIRKSEIRNMSLAFRDSEMGSVLFDRSLTMPTSVALGQPLNALHHHFQNAFQSHGNTRQVFDAILVFIEACSSMIDMIGSKRGITDLRGNDITWLFNEMNTWKLLHALHKDRIASVYDGEDEESSVPTHPLSEKEIIEIFYKMNRQVREAQIVIDWLERNYRDRAELMGPDDVGHYVDKTVAWENTLHQLQSSSVAIPSSRPIVSSLDPDGPLREKQPLHDLDAEDDSRLLRQVFQEIRKGQIDKAQKMCIHCGQEWRAVVLNGWKLFHDPNYVSRDNVRKLPIEGNPMRSIWKLSAWRMCEDSAAPSDEKAIMGALGGHLESVLPFCNDWEDMLWAYTKTSVDIAVESEIRDNSLQDFAPLPPAYWNNRRNMDEILREVSGTEEGHLPSRVIQELVISGRGNELLERAAEWVNSSLCDPQFLRFLAHLVLILRLLGESESIHSGDSIICAYVKILGVEDDMEGVAYYCSLLPEDMQIEEFSRYMESITDSDARLECLSIAEKYDLKVSKITETVVRNVRIKTDEIVVNESERSDISPSIIDKPQEDEELPPTTALFQDILDDDREKISALDWIMFYKNQRAQGLWEANALIRHFIALNKMSAAKLTLDKVPPESTDLILQQYNCTMDGKGAITTKGMPPKASSALKEFLCHKAYLDGIESFSQWFHSFHNTKPTKPLVIPETKDFTAAVTQEHRMEKYEEDMERWKTMMVLQTKQLKSQLMNIIVFPQDGWLIDKSEDEEPRKSHLESLRAMCIPTIFLLLHKVLHSMEMYEEALDLVALLVDESMGHYKLFTKQMLNDMLRKAADSSTALLTRYGSAFGTVAEDEGETESSVTDTQCSPETLDDLFKVYSDRMEEDCTTGESEPSEAL